MFLLGLQGQSGTAEADDYAVGPPEAGYKPDNSEHTYCFRDNYTGDYARNAADRALHVVLDGQTTMFDNKVSGCSGSTDAKFHIENMAGVDGRWTCLDRSGNTCRESLLDFDRGNITSEDDWKQTTCHEVGHSVGLRHASWDCLGTDHSDGQHRQWGDHHVFHVNHDR